MGGGTTGKPFGSKLGMPGEAGRRMGDCMDWGGAKCCGIGDCKGGAAAHGCFGTGVGTCKVLSSSSQNRSMSTGLQLGTRGRSTELPTQCSETPLAGPISHGGNCAADPGRGNACTGIGDVAGLPDGAATSVPAAVATSGDGGRFTHGSISRAWSVDVPTGAWPPRAPLRTRASVSVVCCNSRGKPFPLGSGVQGAT